MNMVKGNKNAAPPKPRKTLMLIAIDVEELKGQTIKSYTFGHPEKTGRNVYGVMTITMESGDVFVFSSSYEEISFWKEVEEGRDKE